MEFKKIREQEEILESKGKNFIVSASAGSGKTSVMIRKIISCLNEVSVKDILVLTYTKASAEEMKQKLLSKIYEEAEKNPELLKEIDDLPTANISTIHSFFQKIIKRYFYVLGLEPNFVLLDEEKTESLKLECLQDATNDFYNKEPILFEKLMDIFGNSRTDSRLQKIIKALSEFCMALEDSEIWVNKTALKLYNSLAKSLESIIKSITFLYNILLLISFKAVL